MKSNFFIKDPIHGLITFDENYKWAEEIIKTKEFWRLNNIKQLGTSWTIFPSATHTRYTHSIGVFVVARKILESITFIESDTSDLENDKKIVCAAALLHDIGHGPFSHTFEEATNYNHEKMGRMIITNSNTNVNQVLKKHNIDPNAVADVIEHKIKKKWMHQVISSQIDADRLDYLPRDSHFTGAKFGTIDYDMLFSNAIVYKDKMYFSKYSWNVLENILLSRYSMFENVYHNKIGVLYDTLMKKTLKRFYDLKKKGNYYFKHKYPSELLRPWINDEEWTPEFIQNLDDHSFTIIMKMFSEENDSILKRLATNWLQNSDFFVYIKNDEKAQHDLRKISKQKYFYDRFEGYDKKIYDSQMPVYLYSASEKGNYRFFKLEEKSLTIAALANYKKPKKKKFIFYHKDLK